MTKRELVQKLHECGEIWANESYPKEYLEKYYNGYKAAESMSLEELEAAIMAKHGRK